MAGVFCCGFLYRVHRRVPLWPRYAAPGQLSLQWATPPSITIGVLCPQTVIAKGSCS
jgi:hypothetical protein